MEHVKYNILILRDINNGLRSNKGQNRELTFFQLKSNDLTFHNKLSLNRHPMYSPSIRTL